MLVLTRREGEKVVITVTETGERIEVDVVVVQCGGSRKVKLGFTADPGRVQILRSELLTREDEK